MSLDADSCRCQKVEHYDRGYGSAVTFAKPWAITNLPASWRRLSREERER